MTYEITKVEKETIANEFELKEIKTIKDINGADVQVYGNTEKVTKERLDRMIQEHQRDIEYHEAEIIKLQEKLGLINTELDKKPISIIK